MKRSRVLGACALAALAMVPPLDASALGLGRPRGAVLLGRPLDLAIPATHEAGDPDTPCVAADVFQGDARVSPRQVGVRWEPGPAGQGIVRVTADVPIEEPLVTLYIRVGCKNPVTRRYVLLPEQALEVEPVRAAPAMAAAVPVARPPEAAPAAPPASARAARAPGTPAATAAGSASDALQIQPAPRLAGAPRDSAKPRRSREAKTGPPPVRGQSRLKLEPLDLAPERAPDLRVSQRLLAEPTQDEERRRQAAALWRAITAGPEEAVRNGARIATLEREVRALGDLTRRHTSALEAIREQTVKARGERNLMAEVAIALAVLLAMGALGFLWWSRRSGGAAMPGWWGRNVESDSEFDTLPPRAYSAKTASGAASILSVPDAADTLVPEQSRVAAAAPAARPQLAETAMPPAGGDFQASYPGSSSRMLNAEELIDIQQQADFFLSIGQHERAISLLESHVHQNESGALAWLDLLEIYHDRGRRDDFERIRSGFQQRFNAHVPGFGDYRSGLVGLEDYGRAMSRIMTLWPTLRVLEVIEDSLLRKPGTADEETFGLEAYRELVLLYNIAKEVAYDEQAELARERPPPPAPEPEAPPSRFGETQRMGLFINEPRPPPAMQEPLLGPGELVWPGAAPEGLDIDLTAMEPEPAEEGHFDLGPQGADFGDGSDPRATPVMEPQPLPQPTPEPLPELGLSSQPDSQSNSQSNSQSSAQPPSTASDAFDDLDSLDWRSVR